MVTSDWESVSFKTNVLIKNIIGKELINDDNVAVMELVKNSYDAGASKVEIEFKNIFNNKDDTNILSQTSQIIIRDDGKGMSKEDIIDKWLNIAYSAKKTESIQNERFQAGNKGVGRFSCDRLGESLNIYTRKLSSSIVHLQITWKDFELLDQINTQIQDIPIKMRNIKDSEFKEKSGFDVFKEGTILQIIKLNTIWAELEEDNLFPKISKPRLLKLKNSLERLINPNQSFDAKSFNIYLKASELLEDKNLKYHERFNGKIINQIFDKLDFKTTYIESIITSDGTKIITELKDKKKTIFRLIEKNNEFPLLKNVRITLYYLNPYAKAYFKRQTGIRSVSFGSIFLFINGFRISPYGDSENDWLGLEQRKLQGVRRNLSGREMLGR
ncbi:MAG: ATP-binding protein, partial [Sulfurimonas sp.]|nr:ATP-binding protein [Sulfurimonas sp.]